MPTKKRTTIGIAVCGGLFILSIVLGVGGFYHVSNVLVTDAKLTLVDMSLLFATPFPIIAAIVVARKLST